MKLCLPTGLYSSVEDLSHCDTYYLAKQNRVSFPNSQTKSTVFFELIHTDEWGLYKFKSHGYYAYFLPIIESKSRAT